MNLNATFQKLRFKGLNFVLRKFLCIITVHLSVIGRITWSITESIGLVFEKVLEHSTSNEYDKSWQCVKLSFLDAVLNTCC